MKCVLEEDCCSNTQIVLMCNSTICKLLPNCYWQILSLSWLLGFSRVSFIHMQMITLLHLHIITQLYLYIFIHKLKWQQVPAKDISLSKVSRHWWKYFHLYFFASIHLLIYLSLLLSLTPPHHFNQSPYLSCDCISRDEGENCHIPSQLKIQVCQNPCQR